MNGQERLLSWEVPSSIETQSQCYIHPVFTHEPTRPVEQPPVQSSQIASTTAPQRPRGAGGRTGPMERGPDPEGPDQEKPQRKTINVCLANKTQENLVRFPNLPLSVGGFTALGKIDSGAEANLIDEGFVRKHGIRHVPKTIPYGIFSIQGRETTKNVTRQTERLPVRVGNREIIIAFNITELGNDVILGEP